MKIRRLFSHTCFALLSIALFINLPVHTTADAALANEHNPQSRNLLEASSENSKGYIRRGKLIADKEFNDSVKNSDGVDPNKQPIPIGNGVVDAFISSLSMILVSEIGDETFIIAALMAMRHPRSIVLAGALCALGIMTVLSTGLGLIVPNLISRKATNGAATILYTFFGLRLLYIAWKSDPNDTPQKELEEVEEMLEMQPALSQDKSEKIHDKNEKNDNYESHDSSSSNSNNSNIHHQQHNLMMMESKQVEEKLETDAPGKSKQRFIRRILARFCTPIFLEAFVLTFLAEWGDRSQIATIALASHKNPVGVTVGATLGHVVCTSLAVVGGRLLALRISQRTVAIVGGLLFLAFAVNSFLRPPL